MLPATGLPLAGGEGKGCSKFEVHYDDRYQGPIGCPGVSERSEDVVSPYCCNLKPTTSKNNCLPVCNNLFSGVNKRFVHYNFAVIPRCAY